MKTQLLTLTMCALFLAAVDSGRAQTNTTPKTTTATNSITYTLDIDPGDGTKSVNNPTEADLRKAIASLRLYAEPQFLTLQKDETHTILISRVAQDGFNIASHEGDEQHQYMTTKYLSIKTATKLLLAYRNGDADWKKLTDWKPM